MRGLSNFSLTGAAVLSIAALAAACGGGSSTPPPVTGNPITPTVVAGSIGATITLSASGVSPADVRIEPTQRVRFVNSDSRPHQINTNPHNFHTDCPPNNTIIINPGQTVDTAIFSDVKPCGYHDHLLPETQSYWGLIRVGTNDDAKGPVYSKGW
jgi:plastocyanin